VRDGRNPIVSCVVEPSAGHEAADPDWYAPAATPRDITVVGGGVAGLEAARVAATRGHRVTLVERSTRLGGIAAVAGPGTAFVDWLVAECQRLGVVVRTDSTFDASASGSHRGAVIEAVGSVPGTRGYEVDEGAAVIDVVDLRTGAAELPATGRVALFDPIGGPIAVALAEELGERAVLITQDHIAGNELSRTGDLAPANVRLAQRGVVVARRALLRSVGPDGVRVQDRFSGEMQLIECVALVDCGFRLPADPVVPGAVRIGDCVAPRTIAEAVLEARRAAAAI
jgi:2,4-dienoyl-CoA reductase (NADPH2)